MTGPEEAGAIEVVLRPRRDERRAVLIVAGLVLALCSVMAVRQPAGSASQILWGLLAVIAASATVRALADGVRPTPSLRITVSGFDAGDGLIAWDDVADMRICEFARFRWVVPRFQYIGVDVRDIASWRQSKNWAGRLEARLARRLLGVDVPIMAFGLGLSLEDTLHLMLTMRSG